MALRFLTIAIPTRFSDSTLDIFRSLLNFIFTQLKVLVNRLCLKVRIVSPQFLLLFNSVFLILLRQVTYRPLHIKYPSDGLM